MKPYHEAEGVTLFLGDCRDVMAQMEPESVSCVCCSPPFFGLRKYTCEPSIWGGDVECQHQWAGQVIEGEGYTSRVRWQHSENGRREEQPTEKRLRDPVTRETRPEAWSTDFGETATCSLCGAWRGWLGLEPTVEMYVEHTIEWLRAVKRVLRKDGVVWLDIDDSRGGSRKGQMGDGSQGRAGAKQRTNKGSVTGGLPTGDGVPAKNLCLVPQRIAIAAQEDGWIVRSEIIVPTWMPESAKDRPTDACRKVLMLVKQKTYWYDGQAVRVEGASITDGRYMSGRHEQEAYGAGWQVDAKFFPPDGLRNLGSVWDDIPPAAYPDSHFAVYPVEEPERCILASCPAEICVKCGKARRRVSEKTWKGRKQSDTKFSNDHQGGPLSGSRQAYRAVGLEGPPEAKTLGWTDCGCGAGFEPGIVLDPFIGTGTTAIAARQLGRRCVGIDASEDYLQQAVTRLTVGDAGIRRMVEARKQGCEQGVLL